MASLSSVQINNPYEVTLHLKQPDAAMVLTLADRTGMMASPTAVKKWGANFANHPVGAGHMWSLSTCQRHAGTEEEPALWQPGKPYLNQITFNFFTDQQTANSAIEDHQAQLELNVALSDVSTLRRCRG